MSTKTVEYPAATDNLIVCRYKGRKDRRYILGFTFVEDEPKRRAVRLRKIDGWYEKTDIENLINELKDVQEIIQS